MAKWELVRIPQSWSSMTELNTDTQYDRVIVWLSLALMLIGLIMVSSASIAISTRLMGDAFYFATRQGIYLLLAIGLALAAMQISVANWQKYSLAILGIALALLLVVLLAGNSVNGAQRWLSLGFFNIQPAEIAKFALLLFLASYLVRKKQEVQEKVIGFIKPILLFGCFALLLLLQPDLGSVVVMFVITVAMIFIAGARLWQFGVLIGIGLFAIVMLILFEPYRMSRVTSFLNPWADPFGSGYQLTQSLMAFGRGGWFGQGLGNSIQKLEYLPEAHTDFVIAILAEEFGFVGVVVVVSIVFALAVRALQISKRCLTMTQEHMRFGGFVALGIAVWIVFQTLVNIGAAAGMIPTKGLTLPLVSYGGSSLMVMAVVVALLMRIDYEYRLMMAQANPRIRKS